MNKYLNHLEKQIGGGYDREDIEVLVDRLFFVLERFTKKIINDTKPSVISTCKETEIKDEDLDIIIKNTVYTYTDSGEKKE
jgi:hypothetical protein